MVFPLSRRVHKGTKTIRPQGDSAILRTGWVLLETTSFALSSKERENRLLFIVNSANLAKESKTILEPLILTFSRWEKGKLADASC